MIGASLDPQLVAKTVRSDGVETLSDVYARLGIHGSEDREKVRQFLEQNGVDLAAVDDVADHPDVSDSGVAAGGETDETGAQTDAGTGEADGSDSDVIDGSDDAGRRTALSIDVEDVPEFWGLVDDDRADEIREANTVDGTAYVPNPLPADAEFWRDVLAPVMPDGVEYGPNGYPVLETADTDCYPEEFKDREMWVLWGLLDGRKLPIDPTKGGKNASWADSDDGPADAIRGFEDAKRWADADQKMIDAAGARPKVNKRFIDGDPVSEREAMEASDEDVEWRAVESPRHTTPQLGAVLQDHDGRDADQCVFIDWDDVRDPETGETHPFCAFWVFAMDCFAEISQSGEGVHQFVRGGMPEDTVKHLGDFDVEFHADGGGRDAATPASVPDDGEKPDDLATAEVYAHRRFMGLTGRRVAGSGDDVVYGRDSVDAIMDATGAFKQFKRDVDDDTGSVSRSYDLAVGEYKGDGLDQLDVPDDAGVDRVCYEACIQARRGAWANVDNWKLIGYIAKLGLEAGLDRSRILADMPDDPRNAAELRKIARKSDGYQPPSPQTLKHAGILPEDYGAGLPDAPGDSQFVDECAPPSDIDASPVDVDAARDRLAGETYDAMKAYDGLAIAAHPPGVGKTTSSAIAAADRDDAFVMLTPSHENAWEFQQDADKPDGMMHLKGGSQPVHDECMKAAVEAGSGDGPAECPRHETVDRCRRMCPGYGATPRDCHGDCGHGSRRACAEAGECGCVECDHSRPFEAEQQLFKRVAEEAGLLTAHRVLDLADEPWHPDTCAWEQQFDDLEHATRVVTVHQYATLTTAVGDGDRTVFVDDLQGSLDDDGHLSPHTIDTYGSVFDDLADNNAQMGHELAKLSEFCDRLASATTGRDAYNADDRLADVDVPAFEVPAGVTTPASDAYEAAEVLSRAARSYYSEMARRLDDSSRGDYSGEPLDVTPLYAAVAAAADDADVAASARIAARQPFILRQCPRDHNHGQLQAHEGRRVCTDCGWDETGSEYAGREFQLHPERIVADIAEDDRDKVGNGVKYRTIPRDDALPNPRDTILLDATPRVDVSKALFGASSAKTWPRDRDYKLPNTVVTQITDGAYHAGTLLDNADDDDDEKTLSRAGERLQNAVEHIDSQHDAPLVIGKKDVLDTMPLPDGVDTRHYGALRGLNETDHDAVVLVGAPHPPEDDIRAVARLLALDSAADAGGREFSTRDGEDAGPPIHRKYKYSDTDGRGYAAETKAYSGLTGDLFASVREDELEQAAHRVRPVLDSAGDESHIYLLTNTPTGLPVDTLTTLKAFDARKQAALGVSGDAVAFLETVAGAVDDFAAFDAPRSDWEDVATDAEDTTPAERSVRRWMQHLAEAGFVQREDRGFPCVTHYQATSDLADVLDG